MPENTQPDLQWGPLEQKPDRRGRVWAIVGLAIAAVVTVGVLLFFLLPRGDGPIDGGTPAPSDASTQTPPTAPDDEPTSPPVTEAPEPVDPSVDEFRAQVEAWLSDASRGLDIVASSSGDDALASVSILQEDAQRLSGVLPPSAIADDWRDAVVAYENSLTELQSTLSAGTDPASSIDSARAEVKSLSDLVGL